MQWIKLVKIEGFREGHLKAGEHAGISEKFVDGELRLRTSIKTQLKRDFLYQIERRVKARNLSFNLPLVQKDSRLERGKQEINLYTEYLFFLTAQTRLLLLSLRNIYHSYIIHFRFILSTTQFPSFRESLIFMQRFKPDIKLWRYYRLRITIPSRVCMWLRV